MLPELDGLSLIEGLRKRGIETPVLILSARQSVDDRIEGLQRGGDDYMVKPFSLMNYWPVSTLCYAADKRVLTPGLSQLENYNLILLSEK